MEKLKHIFKSVSSAMELVTSGEANLDYHDIYHYLLIITLIFKCDFCKALELINRVEFDNILYKQLKADVLYCMNNEASALEIYIDIISTKPQDTYVLLQMARIVVGMEKYEPRREFIHSRKLLNKVLSIDTENYSANNLLEHLNNFELNGYVRRPGQLQTVDLPSIFYPKTLFVFLTTRCNIRCKICARDNYTGLDFCFQNIYKLEKAIRYAEIIDLTGWGECFTYPKIKDVLQYIYTLRNDRCIQITTNGTLLSTEYGKLLSSKIHQLTISLNAATPETYNRDMKYSNFKNTIDSIKAFMCELDKYDRKNICLHFVAHTGNFMEIPKFVSLANEIGVTRISIGNYLASTIHDGEMTLLYVKDKYNAIITTAQILAADLGINFNARLFGSETKLFAQDCKDPFDSCFILPNGEVNGPCCFSGSYLLGNVYDTNFEEVWFSEKYEKLRRLRHLEACRQCVPFTLFDDIECHFTGDIKKSVEFAAHKRLFKGISDQ